MAAAIADAVRALETLGGESRAQREFNEREFNERELNESPNEKVHDLRLIQELSRAMNNCEDSNSNSNSPDRICRTRRLRPLD